MWREKKNKLVKLCQYKEKIGNIGNELCNRKYKF